MKKLITFALLLSLIACEKNEPNIVIPALNNDMTIQEVIVLIGYYDASKAWKNQESSYMLAIYRCAFTEHFGRYIRINGDGRYFYVTFENGKVSKFYYSYLPDDVLVMMKNNPPR